MKGTWRHGYILVALLLSVALAVAACSGGDEGDGDAGGSGAATTTTTSTTATATDTSASSGDTMAKDDAMMEKPEVAYGGKVTFGQRRDVRSGFDPHGTSGGQAQHQNTNSWWYNNLMSRSYGVDVAGGTRESFNDLAQSWEVSDGGLTYTFKLHEGVKFHNRAPVNGREMTSEDVKWSYERFLKGPDSYQFQLADIAEVEAPDKYTVVFRLHEPVASFMVHVGEPLAWVAPMEAASSPPQSPALEGVLDEEFLSTPEGMIGTGPWMFDVWEKDKRLTAVRNPDYFKTDAHGNQLPFIDTMEYVIIPDTQARSAAYISGDIDTFGPPSGSTADFKERNPDSNFVQDLPSTAPTLNFRLDRTPAFNDIRVRRAIAMAFEQQAIMDLLLGSITEPTYGGVPALVFPEYGITPAELGDAAQWWQYNPQAAAALLAEAGYNSDNPLEITYQFSSCCKATYYPELVADMMSDVNVKMTLQEVDHSVHLKTSNIGMGDYDIAHSRLKAAEVDDLLVSFLPGNSKNNSHIDDALLTEMIKAQRLTQDPNQRFNQVRQIQRYLADQVYLIRIPDRFTDFFWQSRIKNFRPHVGNTEGRDWEIAWIEEG
jgi:peptide/nickel transport system substrate-binding protein